MRIAEGRIIVMGENVVNFFGLQKLKEVVESGES
jgi:hypothetical protein